MTPSLLAFVKASESLEQNMILGDILGEKLRRAGVAVEREAGKVRAQQVIILGEMERRGK